MLTSREEYGGDHPLLSLSAQHGVRYRNHGEGRAASDDLSGYRLVRPGDLVINRLSARDGAYAVSTITGLVSPAYWVMRPSGDMDPRWVDYVLRSSPYRAEIGRISKYMPPAQFDLPWQMFRKMPIPAPGLDQQCAIADFLDRETAQIDAMVDAQERLVALLEERRASLVDDLLIRPSDPSRFATELPWLPSVPSSVKLIALKRLLDGIDQGVSPQADSSPAGPGEWGVLTAGCVNGGVFSDEKQKRLDEDFVVDRRHVVELGDLIVSRASGSRKLVGSAGMVEQNRYNLILSDKTFRLHVASDTSKRFLYWFLNSNLYRHQVEGAISGAEGLANNLPLSALRNFQVPLPPLEEQERIARRLDRDVSRIDAMILRTLESIALMKERRAALISAAVTGRIDVRTGIEQVERDLEEARV